MDTQNELILITGGTGSWGNELVRQIVHLQNIKEIRILSRGEHKQVEMRRNFHEYSHKLKFIIGDVRDSNVLNLAMKDVSKVFHMAALKHVPVCEENPFEAIQTNVIGTNNVINAAILNNVARVIFISTDKAADPLNLYGMTKACAEKLVISANNLSDKTAFICLRAGNVLGTNGSVVPLFIEQLKKVNTITITHPDMTRFFLRVEDAIKLVLKAEHEAVGGEITVVKMPACKIIDLAHVLIDEFGDSKTKINTIGIRPGEKLHEVLVTNSEKERLIKKGDWFLILPMLPNQKMKKKYENIPLSSMQHEYTSLNAEQLTPTGIRKMLELGGFLKSSFHTDFSTLGPDELLNYFKQQNWLE